MTRTDGDWNFGIVKLKRNRGHEYRLTGNVFTFYLTSLSYIVMHVHNESSGNRSDQSWSCFVWSHLELYLHRACKMTTLVWLSCLLPLTQPFFSYLITSRRIVPPLANPPVSSMWSPVNRTYQTKDLIRTRPAAKDEALSRRLRALWLQT